MITQVVLNSYEVFAVEDNTVGPVTKIRHKKCGWIEEGGYWYLSLVELMRKVMAHELENSCVPLYKDAT